MNNPPRALPPLAQDERRPFMLHGAKRTRPVARARLALPVLLDREHVDLSVQGDEPDRRRHRTPVASIRRQRHIPRVAVCRVRHRLRLSPSPTSPRVEWQRVLSTATTFHVPESFGLGNNPATHTRSHAFDPEHRMISHIGQSLEVRPGLVAPAREIRLDDARLLVVGDLGGPEGLPPATPAKLASARGSEVPHPLGVPARRDEISADPRAPER